MFEERGEKVDARDAVSIMSRFWKGVKGVFEVIVGFVLGAMFKTEFEDEGDDSGDSDGRSVDAGMAVDERRGVASVVVGMAVDSS
jgi:hypothetical protein